VTQCQEAGMDGHVTKPVNYATLVQAVARGIARCPPSWATGNGVSSRVAAEDQPPPKLDRVVLEHLLAFLTPADTTANLMTLRSCQQRMLQLLDRPAGQSIDQPATRNALTDTARALASTAGMFGFTALSVVARRLECAPDDGDLARQVSEETRAALAVLDTLMSESRMLPVI
jgi:HPt (histidine-containing phosphotransfer) domain-containing protein